MSFVKRLLGQAVVLIGALSAVAGAAEAQVKGKAPSPSPVIDRGPSNVDLVNKALKPGASDPNVPLLIPISLPPRVAKLMRPACLQFSVGKSRAEGCWDCAYRFPSSANLSRLPLHLVSANRWRLALWKGVLGGLLLSRHRSPSSRPVLAAFLASHKLWCVYFPSELVTTRPRRRLSGFDKNEGKIS
jgi:hypothetical protein